MRMMTIRWFGRAVPQEEPAEEMPLDEVPAENEFQIEEEEPVAEVPADALELEEAPLEELPLEEPPLEEIPLEEVPADQVPLEEIPEGALELEEEPVAEGAAPTVELRAHEETKPTEEIEPVDLEAGESEWDFVVEESDGNRSAHDFKIDLDSPHEQPHQ